MLRHSTVLASFGALTLLACSSCSRQSNESQRSDTGDVSSAPNVSPTAAPGVAFNYAYEFSLPDKRIAAAQEGHASACERLGLARCRITGMSYSVDQDEQVSAELDLNLDPTIARAFGKSAQQLVEGNDGKLVRLDIGSSDEGEAISDASTRKGDLSGRLAQLQQELAKTKPGTDARANLMSQIQALQQQASEIERTIQVSQTALASTPMQLHYYGRGGVPGFRGNPISEAWQTLVTTVVWLVDILLQLLAVLLPLSVLLAVAVVMWRSRPIRFVRSWIAASSDTE